MKKFKKFLVIFILFVTYIFISIFSYSNKASANISDNLFRLHVIANSDSSEDQNLKYLVRDALIEYMNSICENISSKDEAIKIAEENKDEFYNIDFLTTPFGKILDNLKECENKKPIVLLSTGETSTGA